MPFVKSFNNQSLGEEIANGVSHCLGALLSIVGTVILIVIAAIRSSAIGVVSASLYGASLILMYTNSTLYHSITNYKAKKIFQIIDHCSIYLLIVGSYIPISLVMLAKLKGMPGLGGMIYMVAGGLFYTIGILFYKMKKTKYMHFIWHLFVLLGSIMHYFFILIYCYPEL